MASNYTDLQSPDTPTAYSPLYSSKLTFTTPEQSLIDDTYRDLVQQGVGYNLNRASTSSVVASSLPVRPPASASTVNDQSSVLFLAPFGELVQRNALGEGIEEKNFHRLTDDDLNRLHPQLNIQFDLRDFRDQKKAALLTNTLPVPDRNQQPTDSQLSAPSTPLSATALLAIRRKLCNPPPPADVKNFISNLKLSPVERLFPFMTRETIADLTTQTDLVMSRLERIRITRSYVLYAFHEYKDRFKTPHVVHDVMARVAESLYTNFPSMRDSDSTKENPTYRDLFERFPLSGSVYNTFININRGLPDGVRGRKRRTTSPRPALPPPPPTYDLLVEELALAGPERRSAILEETYQQRRKWVTQGGENGPGIEAILTKYTCFQTDLKEVGKEFERCVVKGQPEMGYSTLRRILDGMTDGCPIAAVVALLKKIKLTNTNRIAPYIIVKNNPTSSANQTGGVVGCHHENKLYVCVHGGFQVEVPDLVTMLGVIIQFHYILHISFPRPASSVYHFLSHVFGDKTSKSLSKTQKDILRPLA